MSNYVPFTKRQLDEVLVADMGFAVANAGLGEYVYERDVITKSGVAHPYKIRVFSSVLKSTGVTDECGADAIRVVLIDKLTDRPAAGKQRRVHRTKSAMINLRERCRDVFKVVLETPKCPCCGGLMMERVNKKTQQTFMSCSRYAPGTPTHCTGVQAKKAA